MKDTTNIKIRDISKNNKTSSRSNFNNLKIKYSKSTIKIELFYIINN